jgi:sugar O-acyltransferase (sialic acid O-acetyltransferase NeuD family)
MKRIAIIGAGLLGQQIAHYIRNNAENVIAGFFDDNLPVGATVKADMVLGSVNDVPHFYERGKFDQLMMGIGYLHFAYRWECFTRFHPEIPFFSFVHPFCFLDNTVSVGDGSFIMPGCVLDNDVVIGRNVFMQSACVISHHSVIGDNCYLGPGVRVAGCVKIGQGCFLGVGSVCIDSIVIGPDIRIGGGAVITDSILETGLYAGVPARRIK